MGSILSAFQAGVAILRLDLKQRLLRKCGQMDGVGQQKGNVSGVLEGDRRLGHRANLDSIKWHGC